MGTKLQKSMVWMTVLLQLAIGLGAGPVEAFLCIGQDGHIDIEFAADGCCGPRDVQPVKDSCCPAEPTACQFTRVQNCGPCVDIPLLVAGQGQEVTPRQNHIMEYHPVAPTLSGDSPLQAHDPQVPGAIARSPVRGSQDTLLASIVLQI